MKRDQRARGSDDEACDLQISQGCLHLCRRSLALLCQGVNAHALDAQYIEDTLAQRTQILRNRFDAQLALPTSIFKARIVEPLEGR